MNQKGSDTYRTVSTKLSKRFDRKFVYNPSSKQRFQPESKNATVLYIMQHCLLWRGWGKGHGISIDGRSVLLEGDKSLELELAGTGRRIHIGGRAMAGEGPSQTNIPKDPIWLQLPGKTGSFAMSGRWEECVLQQPLGGAKARALHCGAGACPTCS